MTRSTTALLSGRSGRLVETRPSMHGCDVRARSLSRPVRTQAAQSSGARHLSRGRRLRQIACCLALLSVLLAAPVLALPLGPPARVSVGRTPAALAIGDFNHDGVPDVVVANSGDNTVSIIFNNADGSVRGVGAIPVGAQPYAVAVADFNGDGKLDLATANRMDNSVTVLLGNGDGSFRARIDTAVGSGPDAITVGDFNGDGKPDLAVANDLGNTVSVLLGKADGTFLSQQTFAVGSNPLSVAVGDFNGDGKADITVANLNDNTVSVLLGVRAKTLAVNIDRTPPFTSASAMSGSNPFASGGLVKGPVFLALAASDPNLADGTPGSGPASISYQATGAQTLALTTAPGASASLPPITAEGTTTLTYFATDLAGNQEPARTFTVRIDDTAPVVVAVPVPTVTGAVVVLLSAYDPALADGTPGSGVKEIGYTETGAQSITVDGLTNPTTVLLVSAPGTTTIHYTASDNAGNTTTGSLDVSVGPCAASGLTWSVGAPAWTNTTPPALGLPLTITNTASVAASNVSVSGVTADQWVTLSSPTLPDGLGSLAAGASVTVPLRLSVPAGVTAFTLSARLSADCAQVQTPVQRLQAAILVPHPPLAGDVNGDGKVNLADVLLTVRAALHLVTLTPAQQAAADLNGDGSVSVLDVILVLRQALNLP